MTCRSTPASKTDEAAFPVRIKLWLPDGGYGLRMDAMRRWLDLRIGRADYAWHGGGNTTDRSVTCVYFRTPSEADAFLSAFPELQLADGTMLPGYTSPALPFGRTPLEDEAVCNLYNQTVPQDAIRHLFDGFTFTDAIGNLEPGSIYPDRLAPVVRKRSDGLELARGRWGMPSPQSVLKTARDPGVTNVRNTSSPHWRRWLGPGNRCLVPMSSFAEPIQGGNQWFAHADDAPMFFAGIEVRQWKSVRKVKDGETTDDLFAFLTTEPNAEVGAVHPKAMPVILSRSEDWETWLTAPCEIAGKLQRPLPDGSLRLIDGPR